MLAIAHGSKITFWESQSGSQSSFQIASGNIKIFDLKWNHIGNAIAYCTETGGDEQQDSSVRIASITGSRELSIISSFWHSDSPSKATSLSFGLKTSRYLCIGDDHGHVGLWDLKKKSRVRHYQQPVTSPLIIQTSVGDQCIYALSSSAMVVYWIKEGTCRTTISASESRLFTSHAVLPNEAGVILGTEAGNYEVHRFFSGDEKKLTSIAFHEGPVRSVALLGSNFVLTCCTEGILCCSKLMDLTVVHTIQLQTSLTCISVEKDFCAVGSECGKVFVYKKNSLLLDGRASQQQPSATLEFYNGAVTSLDFAPTNLMQSTTSSVSVPETSFSTPTRSTRTQRTEPVASPLQQAVDELGEMVEGVLTRTSENSAKRIPYELSIPQSSARGDMLSQPENLDSLQSATNLLRDELAGSIHDLHVDMIRQFQLQNQHIAEMFARQTEVMNSLVEENERLREENKKLKQGVSE